ncbi:KedN5 family methylcobalamin-dependent radical SAM C-methyltransferase [Nonomuraea longispora]|uniref:KedN5 family methylcobalamin-dependent radical SAM C-methyltransferase n=1 Tax=Nonomuraea longispora TaxID=1848320 RepID=A0A4R4NMA5_9ACTN|nr:KedN5 family methylcobalamin-dependent radical SAM C-methyltransferase [Nonomuraea longispora]TDC08152.1 KedN5 family methylcobalamin-dependent radical SAM C-methyltransferase [Nonomuraea longispora]
MQADGRIVVNILQQGVWDMPYESMPLAAGYLKSTALSEPRIAAGADIRICNYRGAVTLPVMAADLFRGEMPDILACSVLGWNYRAFGTLAETFRQLNPDGWIIFGGTHVANQADRVFGMFPDVDVIVNGEGELVFRDLLGACLDGRSRHDLHAISGISFRDVSGATVTTAERERISDLDIIPSPILTGAIELTGDDGGFRYDVALMETNRGCPYKCSFCYWGGATGQRVRAFSRHRLREELELLAKLNVHTIALCDANFGLLPIDEEFVDDLIEIRGRYGYPKALESSWAKNKSKVFYSIVRKMKQAGLRSSFTLALQTLSDTALGEMNRKNMKVNAWEDLVAWLSEEGLECYAELLWGAPGETIDSFFEGYDRLARKVSRIAVYPLLMLPNTEYSEKKAQYGIVSVRGDTDDFEYVLSHNTMTFEENERMQRFLYWARIMAEYMVLRNIWVPALRLAGLTQSQILRDFESWVEKSDDPRAAPLLTAQALAAADQQAYGPALGYLYGSEDARDLLGRWWAESMSPTLPGGTAALLDEIFRYDLLTLPVYHKEGERRTAPPPPLVEVEGERYHLRRGVELGFPVPQIVAELRAGRDPDLSPLPTRVDLYYKTGFESFAETTNHEEIVYFMGTTLDQVTAAKTATMAAEDAGPDLLPTEPNRLLPILREHGGCS